MSALGQSGRRIRHYFPATKSWSRAAFNPRNSVRREILKVAATSAADSSPFSISAVRETPCSDSHFTSGPSRLPALRAMAKWTSASARAFASRMCHANQISIRFVTVRQSQPSV